MVQKCDLGAAVGDGEGTQLFSLLCLLFGRQECAQLHVAGRPLLARCSPAFQRCAGRAG